MFGLAQHLETRYPALAALGRLVRARARVARGWTRVRSARRADGTPCTAADPQAAQWCARGALWAEGDLGDHANRYLENDPCVPHRAVAAWNDAAGRTQAEVVALYDRAVARLLGSVGRCGVCAGPVTVLDPSERVGAGLPRERTCAACRAGGAS